MLGAGEDGGSKVGEGADGEEVARGIEECELPVFKPGDPEAVGAVVGEFGFEVGGHDQMLSVTASQYACQANHGNLSSYHANAICIRFISPALADEAGLAHSPVVPGWFQHEGALVLC